MRLDNIAIELKHATKHYQLYANTFAQMLGALGVKTSRHHKTALENVSLRIFQGEKVGVIGRNGSGKTTLLKMVVGHTRLSHGEILVEGQIQSLMQMGYAFNHDLSGWDNVNNALIYAGLDKSARISTLADIEEFVELGQFFYLPIKTYSLGMLARLEFATATAVKPDILAIDEVLGAGDGYFVKKCAERMHKLIEDTTLLLVSHSLDQISTYCDRVLWLDRGQLIKDGPTQEVIQAYREFMNSDDEEGVGRTSRVRGQVHDLDKKAATAVRKAKDIFKKRIPAGNTSRIRLSCVFDEGNKTSLFSETGKSLSVRFDIELPVDGPLTVQPALLGMSEHGALIFEVVAESVELNKTCSLLLNNKAAGIGVGNYFLIPILRRQDGSILEVGDSALFLSMLTTNWSDPPLLHMDGQWMSGADRLLIPSKISAWV